MPDASEEMPVWGWGAAAGPGRQKRIRLARSGLGSGV